MARTIAKDHDEKRTQILNMAAKVFAETGFDRASMSQLAEACGISKAAIYHYYDSKDALLFDILDSYLSALRDRIAAVARNDRSDEAYLRALILEILLAYHGADDEHRVQVSGMGALPENQQKVLRGYQRALVDQLAEAVQAVAPSKIGADPKALRAATMSVFGMLNWFYMWNRDDSVAAREAYAKHVGDLVMRGVAGIDIH